MWDSPLTVSQAASPKGIKCCGQEATELPAPPYEDGFSHTITIQSSNDSDSDLMSGEEGALAHQVQETVHLGVPHRPRTVLFLLRVPCRLPCRQLIVRERIQLV
jgi:hypothetical protein